MSLIGDRLSNHGAVRPMASCRAATNCLSPSLSRSAGPPPPAVLHTTHLCFYSNPPSSLYCLFSFERPSHDCLSDTGGPLLASSWSIHLLDFFSTICYPLHIPTVSDFIMRSYHLTSSNLRTRGSKSCTTVIISLHSLYRDTGRKYSGLGDHELWDFNVVRSIDESAWASFIQEL